MLSGAVPAVPSYFGQLWFENGPPKLGGQRDRFAISRGVVPETETFSVGNHPSRALRGFPLLT